MASINLDYAALAQVLQPYLRGPHTESRAFLAWYLENLYRLEPTAAEDAVCDGPDDKGIDGIYVDYVNARIDVLQAKIVKSPAKTLGSTQLKEFSGTLDQFATPETIDHIANTTTNVELRGVLNTEKVAQLMRDGFAVRGVFVTNARSDPDATSFLASSPAPILLVDRDRIESAYIPSGHLVPATRPMSFDVFGYAVAEYRVREERIIVAPLAATELVQMEGIQSGRLFDYNVRQSLGPTNVNKDIAKSIRDPAEHANFLLYHNGITVVSEKVDTAVPDKVTITNYVVVNGCQSLSVLWEHRDQITSDLRILARIIELEWSSPLMDLITDHSNNQNGIKPRDFQSNNPIQTRLQNEFAQTFPGQVFYRISRGEATSLPEVIDNELAGRVLLAFDLQQPWTAHQTYKLFDELHSNIFARPEVNAARIVALTDLFSVVSEAAETIKEPGLANYTLTKFFLLYVLRRVLDEDATGKRFITDPATFLGQPSGRERLRTCVADVLKDLVVDLDAEVSERVEKQGAIDFKRLLKSPEQVRELTKEVKTSYLKTVGRQRVPSFTDLWTKSGAS